MPTPQYTTDLTLITEAESTAGFGSIGGGSLASTPSFAMQGINAVDKGTSGSQTRGAAFNGSALTLGADDHIFVLLFVASPKITDTIANEGVAIVTGDNTNVYIAYHIEGLDTYGGSGRVGKAYAIRHNNTASAIHPFRTLYGVPSAIPSATGAKFTTTATGRFGLDVMRWGSGCYIIDGEIADPATFDGMAEESDLVDNRYGLALPINGSVEIQGKFVIGQNSSKVATLCYFEASNTDLLFVDAFHANTDFNEIIIDHASTTCIWNIINIKALGTHTRGNITVNSANPTFTVNGGVWTAIGLIVLRSNSTLDGVTLRDTDSITLNGGVFINGFIDSCRAVSAILTDDLSLVTNGSFTSSGTGHAIDLGTVSATASITWDNNDFDYTDASSGNETILVSVDSGQTLTIDVEAGRTTPSVYNTGLGIVLVVAGQKTLTVKGLIAGESEVRVRDGSVTLPNGHVPNNPTDTFTMAFSVYTTANIVKLQITTNGFDYITKEIELFETDLLVDVTTEMIPDPSWVE